MTSFVAELYRMAEGERRAIETESFDATDDQDAIRRATEWAVTVVGMIDQAVQTHGLIRHGEAQDDRGKDQEIFERVHDGPLSELCQCKLRYSAKLPDQDCDLRHKCSDGHRRHTKGSYPHKS